MEDRPGDDVRRDAHPAWRPGQTVAGRYRLDEHRPADLPGSERWDATDQILARRVTLTLLAGPRTGAAVDGARRAALVVDARLARILDVGTVDGTGYVVTEPAEGRTLASLVATAPLSPDQARAVVGEAAGALEAARRRGVHHLALRPAAIRITSAGRVVLDGLAVDGELLGTTGGGAHATSRTDTVGLVRLLYTALTGRWPVAPGAETTAGDLPSFAEWTAAPRATTPTSSPLADLDTGLPLAPEADGAPVPPAEIVPGLPADLDTLCTVTLGPHDDGPHSPGELVRELEPWRAVRADAIFQAADAGRWTPVGGPDAGRWTPVGGPGTSTGGTEGSSAGAAAGAGAAGAAGVTALGAAASGIADAASGAAGAAAAGIGSAAASGATASTPARPTRPTRTPVAARTAPVGTPRVEPTTDPTTPPTPAEAPASRPEDPAPTDEPTPTAAADPAPAGDTTRTTAQITPVTGPTTATLPEAVPGTASDVATPEPAVPPVATPTTPVPSAPAAPAAPIAASSTAPTTPAPTATPTPDAPEPDAAPATPPTRSTAEPARAEQAPPTDPPTGSDPMTDSPRSTPTPDDEGTTDRSTTAPSTPARQSVRSAFGKDDGPGSRRPGTPPPATPAPASFPPAAATPAAPVRTSTRATPAAPAVPPTVPPVAAPAAAQAIPPQTVQQPAAPPTVPPATGRPTPAPQPAPAQAAPWELPFDGEAPRRSGGQRRLDPTRWVLGVVALAVVVVVVIAIGNVLAPWRDSASDTATTPAVVATQPSAEQTEAPGGEAPAATVPPQIAAVNSVDPSDGDGEHEELVGRITDGDPATAWYTHTYNRPDFAGFKPGVGLVITLAQPATVTSITLDVNGTGGNVEVRATDAANPTTGDVLASGAMNGQTVLTLAQPTETQSIVLWFTSLSQTADGANRIEISGLTVS